jgi:hypothetical protein
MNLQSFEINQTELITAQADLSVLKDLFHTLNDAGISLSSLNSLIALLEKYIENASMITPDFDPLLLPGTKYNLIKNTQVWRKRSRTFAYQQV